MRSNTLILTYNGIGDAIIHAPYVKHITSHYGYHVTLTANSFYDYLLQSEYFDKHLITIAPALVRHMFQETNHQSALQFLSQNNIELIINTRVDFFKSPVNYASLMKKIREMGVEVTDSSIRDICWRDRNVRSVVHDIFSSITKFPYREQWLISETPAGINHGELLLYIGSSTANKCFSDRTIIELLNRASRESYETKLISGKLPHELSQSSRLRKLGFDVQIFESLEQSVERIARAGYIITTDTFISHLAEALGAPCTTIYGATNSIIYEPLSEKSRTIQSESYFTCDQKTVFGNCNLWDKVCEHRDCWQGINIDEAIIDVRND